MHYNYAPDITNISTDIINQSDWLEDYHWSAVGTILLGFLEWSFPSLPIAFHLDPFNWTSTSALKRACSLLITSSFA